MLLSAVAVAGVAAEEEAVKAVELEAAEVPECLRCLAFAHTQWCFRCRVREHEKMRQW